MIPHAAEIEALWQQSLKARREYRLHPIVAIEEDWCAYCCYPRRLRRCFRCNELSLRPARQRAKEAGK